MEIVLIWTGGPDVEGNGPDLPLPARNLTQADLDERGISLENALRRGKYALPTMRHQQEQSDEGQVLEPDSES